MISNEYMVQWYITYILYRSEHEHTHYDCAKEMHMTGMW